MSKFSKRHYEMIASEIKRNVQKENSDCKTLRELAKDLCYTFENDYPNFKRDKFLHACQLS